MHTNLMPDYQNHYFRVRRGFEVFARVGWSKSNSYYGSSMILGTVYRRLRLTRGDQIHALVGGTFAVLKSGEVFSITIQISDKGAFEKSYGGGETERWPLAALDELPKARARRPAAPGYHREVPEMAPGRFVGRSIHSVLD